MKNIFIVGIPRSGKSTLSKLIKEKYPEYNQLSFEAIRNAFQETQPELDMGNRNSSARKSILPKHIVTLAHWNNKMLSKPSLIEGDFCSIEELNNLVTDEDVVICLGLGCRKLDDIVTGINNNDTNDDYTKEWTNDKIKNHFFDIEEKDKYNNDYCIKNNITYYDTYEKRKEIFEDIINNIDRY